MQKINENLIVLGVPDKWDDTMNDYLKIYLTGTISLNSEKISWQEKFIQSMGILVDPEKGNLKFNQKKYIIFNPRMDIKNTTPGLENSEFINKTKWELKMMSLSDGIFCNFLKKSKSPYSMHGFLMATFSGKIITRCPIEYINYPLIKIICDNNKIPLLGDPGTTEDVIKLFYKNITRFSEIQKFGLDEESKK